ncbi:PH, RCC1 and FYVE domains-containing protein 1-like [Argentina anserina]|uniref:PH, RCC1 and FYVE domains-containing protein 1-like n=1 Tax=Argentina anserina TaxID=57926 RepID=UPI0021769510|nr:PH, RCC1 and FYVE domains-containing protein 1-like [Potentilla anserina]
MANRSIFGNLERDYDQALIALKKGTQLLKYSRKGKPKLCPFRLSGDERTLIWLSRGEERHLILSSVTRIIPGQRTAVFRRYLRPEKDYLSFSLLYNNGERSLDLVCKDKAEVEIWIAGLKSLISSGQQQRSRRSRSDISDYQDGSESVSGRSYGAFLDYTPSTAHGRISVDSRESVSFGSSDMQLRTSTGDGFRISVSSTPSCSSGGSGPDDIESLGDVYVWGEIWSDGNVSDGYANVVPIKTDVLIPKPLETNVVLDVHQIACGVRHIALVTRQGEVFTWGEESGGRLGHGIDRDFSRPRLVEFLALHTIENIACGEYHSCAVSMSGDLFTWGDGTHNAGLLGHGTDVSHWIPKRITGPLEGLQVMSVACGTWHSALATYNGKLFTFGDGKFGVLGHGDRESVTYPKEVQLLSGLKTIKVACGVWHTAAIVEVMGQAGVNVSSRKLFTWGDGDKHRLGHGSKDTYLLPTCVSSLIDYNFHQLACGHTMTIALTTSGHVFTMGGTAYGQLGNPSSDGKAPCLVQDKLVGEFVEEIACGAYHVAVLTSRSEVFTWGKGANGRLGHGDIEDRRTPTLVEALKDRHVKSISCGSNFTSSICIHKWVSGADQSVCSGCRQAFGFTRKRHNCYNCGLVHCHACSSKKALRAALAPTPGKPHRVCDSCYAKLKSAEAGNSTSVSRRATINRSMDRDGLSRGEVRSSRILLPPIIEPVKYLEIKSMKAGSRSESPSIVRASQVPSLLQLKDIAFPSSLSVLQNALRPVIPVTPQSSTPNSRSSSPYTRRPSPPRSTTPIFSRSVIDSLKRTNDSMTHEITKLQHQVRNLKHKCDTQDLEIRKLHKNARQAGSVAEEQFSKCRAAKELVKSITEQMKEFAEKLPPEVSDNDNFKSLHAEAEEFINTRSGRLSLDLDRQGAADKSSESSKREDNRVDDHVVSVDPQSISGSSSKSHESSATRTEGQKEVIEQFEAGVYVTLIQLPNGARAFKRVKFSKRRFSSQQAEEWWNNNKERLLRRYSQPRTSHPPPSAPSSSNYTQPPEDQNSSEATSSPNQNNSEAAVSSSNENNPEAASTSNESNPEAASASDT